jgi:alpha-galactosidase
MEQTIRELPTAPQFRHVLGIAALAAILAASRTPLWAGPPGEPGPMGAAPSPSTAPTAAEIEVMRRWTRANLGADAKAPPFSFVCGGRPSASILAGWKATETSRELDRGRVERTVVRVDPESGLEVRCEAIEAAGHPAVEWVVSFRNGGTRDVPVLEDFRALDMTAPLGPGEGLVVHHGKGSDAAISDFAPRADAVGPGGSLALSSHGRGGARGGLPSVESLPFFNLDAGGRGGFVGIGWSGPWTARIGRPADGSFRLQAGLERLRLRLRPGEEIRGPRIVLLFWTGSVPRAHNLWRRLLLDHFSPRPGGKPFAGLIADGNWGSWMTADRHIEEIRWWGDHDLPMECYWVDAGWTDMSLGWEAHQSHQVPSKALFPDGMKPLADAAHARGMKFLLWMVPGSAHPAVGIGKEHPEWLGKPFGDKAYGSMVFHGLDLGDPAVNRHVIDHFSKVVDDFGVDIFRQDGGNLWPEDIDPERIGMSGIRYIRGSYEFWDGLLKSHPGLLIDNCAEGGRKIDLESIRRSIVLWRSDCQASGEFDPISTQGFTHGLLRWIPLCGAVVPTRSLTAYSFRSAYCPAILLGWPMVPVRDLKDRWSGIDLDLLRKLLKEYVAVRPYVFGDFYPLTTYGIEAKEWMAWQFDRPDLGEGMVQAFRRQDCAGSVERYRLIGLDPDASYALTDLDSGVGPEATGRELMEGGLEVTVTGRPGAAVVTYRKVVGPGGTIPGTR